MTTYTPYGAQGGDNGGGFVYGDSQPGRGTQGGQGGGKSFSDESLRPVTVRQLLDVEEAYPSADFVIDGHPITQLTVVGQIRQINPQPTNITYRLDDGTGVIDVKKWVDVDNPGDTIPKYQLDQYVRVWGRLKIFNQKKHVGSHFIRAVDDFNEVNYHLVESTYVHLYFTKGDLSAANNGGGGNAANEDSMFVDPYGSTTMGNDRNPKLAVCGPSAQRLYKFLSTAPGGNEGVHLNLVTSGTGMTTREVLAAADELLGQGLIYNTFDDETWVILEH